MNVQPSIKSSANGTNKPQPDRQTQVLEAALALLVEGGEKAITTAGVARAANCSKESLYKWFGDRDGMLAHMVSHQASKVRTLGSDEALADGGAALCDNLVEFATDLLEVLSSDSSLAMNRLAIGAAGREDSKLGEHLLSRGKKQISDRAGILLKRGKMLGQLKFDDAQEAFETLYGLIVRDEHLRLLLGEGAALTADQAEAQATTAIQQFLRLYGVEDIQKHS